ncbi:MAG: chemotaxis protein CheW [Bacteroidota bacterium]
MALGNNLNKGEEGTSGSTPALDPVAAATTEASIASLPIFDDEEDHDEDLHSDRVMVIVFPIGGEEFAIPIDMVNEVVKTPPIAPIPQTKPFVKGVANVRGNVYTMIDLATKLGMEVTEESYEDSYCMVIKSDEYQVAAIVDRVPDTMAVFEREIEHSSGVMVQSSQADAYIKNIVKREDRMIMLLDIIDLIEEEVIEENL